MLSASAASANSPTSRSSPFALLCSCSPAKRLRLTSLPPKPQIGRVINDPYPNGAWADPAGNGYSLTLVSGTASSTSTVSIGNVTPGGGFQTAGTVLQIDGTGSTEATRITADGIAFSATKFISPMRIEATLASSVELTGIRFHVNTNTYFAHPLDFRHSPATHARNTWPTSISSSPERPEADEYYPPRRWRSNFGVCKTPAQPLELRVLDTAMSSPYASRRVTVRSAAGLLAACHTSR